MIGVLFNSTRYKKLMAKKQRPPIVFFQEAADECAVDLCFFSMRRIRNNGSVRAHVYRQRDGMWREMTVPLPSITLVRTIMAKQRTVKRLEKLEKRFGIQFLNRSTPANRDKYLNYDILSRHRDVAEHLPYTSQFSMDALFSFINEYKYVFIKPKVGSLGKNICFVYQKKENTYVVEGGLTKQYTRFCFSQKQLARYFKEHISKRKHKYIIQQAIHHMTVDDRKFDIRVSVQKNGSGIWQMTGMIARIAQRDKYLTNIAQGAQAQPISAIPYCQNQQVISQIEQLCLRVASILEEQDESISDFGMDIILDKEGKPFLLEVNYRDQRVTYRYAKEWEMWRNTYRNTVLYAHYVQKKSLYNWNDSGSIN